MDDQFRISLDIDDERLLPHLSYLLQDLDTLGGNPEVAVQLLRRHQVVTPASRVIDLGCGKGATVRTLAALFPGSFLGVDIMDEFVAAGQAAIAAAYLDNCRLRTEDLRDTVSRGERFDLVIYGHDADLLGSCPATLAALAGITAPGGHILYETAYHDGHGDGGGCPSENDLRRNLAESPLLVVDQEPWPAGDLRELNRTNNRLMARRVAELSRDFPEQAELFAAYYQRQLDESSYLDEHVQCIAFLLRPEVLR